MADKLAPYGLPVHGAAELRVRIKDGSHGQENLVFL